jgi:hypothetical protein
MSNTTVIAAHLDSPKYDVVRDALRASDLKWATDGTARFIAQVEKLTETDFAEMEAARRSYGKERRSFPSLGFISTFLTSDVNQAIRAKVHSKFGYVSAGYYAHLRDVVLSFKDAFQIDPAKVQQFSDAQWAEHKAFYAARVGQKISELLEGDAAIECDLELEASLVGFITAKLDGKVLRLRTSLKNNYRYGECAADGVMTSYRQVPTLIESAEGFDVVARQLEIDRAVVQAKNDRKAAITAIETEIKVLTRRKRRWDDLYSTMSYCAKHNGGVIANGNLQSITEDWKALGNNPEIQSLPTLAGAKVAVKETRAALQAAKEKLKLAKAAK